MRFTASLLHRSRSCSVASWMTAIVVLWSNTASASASETTFPDLVDIVLVANLMKCSGLLIVANCTVAGYSRRWRSGQLSLTGYMRSSSLRTPTSALRLSLAFLCTSLFSLAVLRRLPGLDLVPCQLRSCKTHSLQFIHAQMTRPLLRLDR
jgi:hypothetical protein